MGHRDCCVSNVTLFLKSVSDLYPRDFLGKRTVFYQEYFFRVSALLHITSLDF